MNLDKITKKYTAYDTFGDFVSAGYCPTIHTRGSKEKAFLANEFDAAQKFLGRPHRAWRGRNKNWVKIQEEIQKWEKEVEALENKLFEFLGLDLPDLELPDLDELELEAASKPPQQRKKRNMSEFQKPIPGLSQEQIKANAAKIKNHTWRYQVLPLKNPHYFPIHNDFPLLGILEIERVRNNNFTVFLCDMYTPVDQLDNQPKIHFISAEALATAGWELD